jgi:hypothetical protein
MGLESHFSVVVAVDGGENNAEYVNVGQWKAYGRA